MMFTISGSTKRALAYGTTGFSAALLNNIYGLYLIDLFLTANQLEDRYFYQAQIIYAIWNAVNDPLFGWLLDHTNIAGDNRLPAIKYGGPLWACVFLIPWFQWSAGSPFLVGLHFVFSMCIFDAFLTYVLLVHSALLADLTADNKERNKMNNFAAFGGLVGYCFSSCSYFFWDKSSLGMFRLFCVLCAFIACWGFYYTATQLQGFLHERKVRSQEKKAPHLPFTTFIKQILSLPNFWLYVLMNFVQNFNVFFDNNFFTMFDDKIFKPTFSTFGREATIFCHLALPKLMIQVLTPFANHYGTYKIIYWCTITKLVSSIAMYFFGIVDSHVGLHIWAVLCLVIRLSNCSWGFYNLAMADVIDEDIVKHNRAESVAVSIHGIQALFVKPAQSLAPAVGVWFLSANQNYKLPMEEIDGDMLRGIQSTMLSLACMVPLGCAIAQLLIWRFYSLHGQKLKRVKEALAEMSSSTPSPRALV